LKAFAEERGLKWKQDAVGNLAVYRPGSGGGEDAPTVVLQVASRHPSLLRRLSRCSRLRSWLPCMRSCAGAPVNASLRLRQGHVDMVCEKDSDVDFDFFNDPLRLVIEGDWVKVRRLRHAILLALRPASRSRPAKGSRNAVGKTLSECGRR
jgi:dipeptidase D